MASSGIKDRVAIVGMGCTRFGELWDKGVDDLLTDAATEATASAGVPFDDIEVVLADNICQRGVVFGAELPGGDPWAVAASVTKHASDGRATVAEGRLSEDPATTAAFVRTYLAAHGAALAPGDRIIAGSLVPPVAVTAGDELRVTFGPFGELRVVFS